MAKRIAINGFGRIGRLVMRIGWGSPELEFVAINDITTADINAYLLKYDSVHGVWNHDVKHTENAILVDGKNIPVFAEADPAKLPWKSLEVDIVVESTGKFTEREKAAKHIDAGAKKVFISAPGKNIDGTFIIGVNEKEYDPEQHHIISIGSCTTNALIPMVKVLRENFGIKQALMTTIHAYTNDQRILDMPHKDPRRARAAGLSMIPTSTGAAKTAGVIYPELVGKFHGISIRVPVFDGSCVDLNVQLSSEVTAEQINQAFKRASEGALAGILQYTEDPIVSIDVVGNPHSCVFDALSTNVIGGKGDFAKLIGWYDNEIGFSHRMIDILKIM